MSTRFPLPACRRRLCKSALSGIGTFQVNFHNSHRILTVNNIRSDRTQLRQFSHTPICSALWKTKNEDSTNLPTSTDGGSAITQTDELDNPPGLIEFFDFEGNWGMDVQLPATRRPGRSWSVDELRAKNNEDLHVLWYLLLKERNMLLTMEHACMQEYKAFPNPERIDRVEESMANLETVVRERNRAYLLLETGQTGERPSRTVTSFAGFRYKKYLDEHLEPPRPDQIEYEQPDLPDDAYMTQKLWRERQWYKGERDKEDELRKQGQLKYVYRSYGELPKYEKSGSK